MRSSRYWFYLLLISPFLNIINYRIGESYGFAIVLVLLLLFVLTDKKRRPLVKQEKKVFQIFVVSLIFILTGLFFSSFYSIDNFYYYRFFCLSFILIPVFLFRGDSGSFIRNKLLFILRYYIILITLSITIGFILKIAGLDQMEPMYDAEKWTYLDRPFGIFGQPSVNSGLLCFFYLFHRSAIKLWSDNYTARMDYLFYIVTLGVILQGSGSGFLSYAFVLVGKLLGKKINISWGRLALGSGIVLLILYKIVVSGMVEKISLDYIGALQEFIDVYLLTPYSQLIKNRAYLLWGVPDFPLSIDLGPLYMMGTIGLVVTVFIFLFLFFMTKKTKSLDMKLGIIMLIVGNLHYPVMFYMVMHFMWYIIVYYVLVLEKSSVMTIKNANTYNWKKQLYR